MQVKVSTKVYPTEDKGMVKKALLSLFPDLLIHQDGNKLVGTGSDISRFQDLIRSRRIRNTIEDALKANYSSKKTWIRLNKQDAVKGIVNISERSPLGDILVEFFLDPDEITDLVWGEKNGSGSEV